MEATTVGFVGVLVHSAVEQWPSANTASTVLF